MTTKIIVTTGHDYQNPKTSNLFYEHWALGVSHWAIAPLSIAPLHRRHNRLHQFSGRIPQPTPYTPLKSHSLPHS
ncbi:hypothetical protein H6G96_32470 [Nostoc sp. FACHB-892]|uniref:hypothetical protein n=1 Tax=Nostoc sp. FACHB-892 TaxID=2692843 RepID=UPI001685F987|nr:hypothetical protein [Nostoc sp. FACHB-892]MBD2730907.1 hypothetical protein [Nostoc sp. FACHB-892]